MNIYTKKGDDGTSALFSSERISKSDIRFELLGSIDELNSHLGLVRGLVREDTQLKEFIETIQRRLIKIAAHVYNSENPDYFTPDSDIKALEEKIDEMQKDYHFEGFVLPGGTVLSGEMDVARTVARRTERCMVRVSENYPLEEASCKYMNRISDYLFMLARTRGGECQ